MFYSREKMEVMLLKELQLYFSIEGLKISKNDTLNLNAKVPHPITGEFIEKNLKFYYDKAYSDSSCDVHVIQSLDDLMLPSTERARNGNDRKN